jgi:hypothetical protein
MLVEPCLEHFVHLVRLGEQDASAFVYATFH